MVNLMNGGGDVGVQKEVGVGVGEEVGLEGQLESKLESEKKWN